MNNPASGPPGLPEDDFDILAAEFVLHLLDDSEAARAAALRQRDARFDATVQAWEARLVPLAHELPPLAPSAKVWAGIDAAIRLPAVPKQYAGLWNSLKFWRYFGLGSAVFGAAGLAVALVAAFMVHAPAPVPLAIAMLRTPNAGVFVATAQKADNGLQLIISPSQTNVPAGKSAELWLITTGNKPQALGLLAGNHSTIVTFGAGQLSGNIAAAELAVSLEPEGGSPTGQPTGPVIAAAKFSLL